MFPCDAAHWMEWLLCGKYSQVGKPHITLFLLMLYLIFISRSGYLISRHLGDRLLVLISTIIVVMKSIQILWLLRDKKIHLLKLKPIISICLHAD
jgi:hypothetical protein